MLAVQAWADSPVAIVGVGCVLPGAPDAHAFERVIRRGEDHVREAPPFRADLHFHFDPSGRDPDKSYTMLGGYVDDEAFSRNVARVAPDWVDSVDRAQAMAIEAARQAASDVGWSAHPLRTGVVLGNSMGGTRRSANTWRIHAREFQHAIMRSDAWRRLSQGMRNDLEGRMRAVILEKAEMPAWSVLGESAGMFAGILGGILDAQGPRLGVDAACASSLAAIDRACELLRANDVDLVYAGGADSSMEPVIFTKFCRMGVLSRTGSRPFDAQADGFVMGEGAAMFALTRQSVAERAGLRVHATLLGVGASSDGRASSIAAPNAQQQAAAIQRAHQAARIKANQVGYVEAHGTSTPIGDVTEARGLGIAFGDTAHRSLPVGSVKSQIGHLKSAAAAAGLLKAVISVEHGFIPPTIHVTKPNPAIDWEHGPIRLHEQLGSWASVERVAGVSAFGFGGTNYHALIRSSRS